MIESESAQKPDACADGFSLREISGDVLDGAALTFEAVFRFSGSCIVQVGVGEIFAAKREPNGTIFGIKRHTERVDVMKGFLPSGGDDNFLIGPPIAVRIEEERDPVFAGHERAIAARVFFGPQGETNRRAQWLFVPKN